MNIKPFNLTLTFLFTITAMVLVSACLFSISSIGTIAYAAEETRLFSNQQYEKRYNKLIAEIRCLVCQNQNIADSNADLATDLRDKTFQLIEQGKSDNDIKEFMRNRFGDFVLYSPPVTSNTLLLWFGPILVLFIVLMLVFRFIANQNRIANNKAKENTQAIE